MDNFDRGLRFIGVDLLSVKLFVFVDGSFAMNADYSSQIGYVAVLGNEEYSDGRFDLMVNVLH